MRLHFNCVTKKNKIYRQQMSSFKLQMHYKKAELSQRWPRDAPYTWVSWKFSGVPGYAPAYEIL